jgi:PAS domain S-box-containing protein
MPNMSQHRLQSRQRAEREEQPRVREIAKSVAATVGEGFFRSLVEHLATALDGDCVYVGEFNDGPVPKLQTVAVYRDGAPADAFEQNLNGSCADQVLTDGSMAWSRDVRRIFPADSVLEEMRAEGYVGFRLTDSMGQVIGLIALIGRDRLQHLAATKSVIGAFAARASAELERKRADDALRQSEQRYRAFISASRDGMWRIELAKPVPLELPEDEQIERIYRDGYLAECNDAMARLAGARDAEELVGTQLSALFSETDDRIREELRAAVRSRYSSASIITMPLAPDGKRQYRLRTQCGIVENDELRRIWGTTRDVTELKMAELAVEASERRFREVLQNIHVPALMLSRTGEITFCNEALLAIANSTGGLLGENWLDLIRDTRERPVWAALLSSQFAQQETQFHFEGVLQLRDAAPRLVVWDIIVLRDDTGDSVGLAAIGRDITDQRAMQDRLAQVVKLEAIGRLAAGIAHDFNNALTLIMGYVEFALNQVKPTEPLYKTLVGIQSASSDCAVLAEQLLAIGYRQQLRPELLNLNSMIDAQQDTIERIVGPAVKVVKELDAGIGLVWVDPVQVRRILINLATNARDAMPNGGTLTVSTANVEMDGGASGLPTGEYVRLAVADTGPGLSEEVRQHLFEPFFTTKAPGKGAGLGLTTIYGIVTQSGGYISARNPGVGALIEIFLPRRENVPLESKSSAP